MCDFRTGRVCHTDEKNKSSTVVISADTVCAEVFRSGLTAQVTIYELGQHKGQTIVNLPFTEDVDLEVFWAFDSLAEYGQPHESPYLVSNLRDLYAAREACLEWFRQQEAIPAVVI